MSHPWSIGKPSAAYSQEREYRLLAKITELEMLVKEAVPWLEGVHSEEAMGAHTPECWEDLDRVKSWLERAAKATGEGKA